MAKSPILGGFSTQISPNAADNTAINLLVEIIETQDAKVPGFLRGASGLDIVNTVGRGGLTGGTVSAAGTGYAFGDLITLVPVDGTNYGAPVIKVTSLVGSGVVTFDVVAAGISSGLPTSFTQFSTTGSGTGFTLSLPTWFTYGPVRGVRVLNDTLYAVAGPEVWSLSPIGAKTLCGTIGDEKTPVSMFQNTKQLMIVDGVGGWLVPGGYPLTAATIDDPGGLYAVNDTIVLRATSGVQNSYPIIKVTSVANHAVATYHLDNNGTTYATGTSATTPIQPQPGAGSGLTLNLTAVGGSITAAAINAGGTGYAVNDTGAITGGGAQDAVYLVTSVAGGVVTGIILLNRGVGYGTGAAVSTSAIVGNMAVNVGLGLTFNITAAGAISASSILSGGSNYAKGNYGYLSAGTGDATYVVDTVTSTGVVTGFTITQGGAIADPALGFVQKSTTGSGSGLTLTSPSFGSYVGLVPVDVPFDNPVVGDVSDGYGLLVFLNSQNLAASDELDLSVWQPLHFGVSNQSPDNNISVAVIHDEAFVLKENNTEVWIDQGLPNFPFAPITSTHIEFGCVAPFSVAKADSELIFLSRNDQGEGVVIMLKGYTPVPISTQALVTEFQKYPNLGDAIAYARQEGQHTYYVITFPEANKTWQYDKTASALAGAPIWTELAALDNGSLNRHWGNCYTPFRGSGSPTTTVVSYQPKSVILTSPTEMATAARLRGLPASISTALLSIWIDAPDTDGSGVIFSNQTDDSLGTTNPGLFIEIQNDTLGTPQITIKAWDAGNAIIVSATYPFTVWAAWVNFLISIDTAANTLQVYANTVVAGSLVEDHLTPTTLTWSSTNPIGATSSQPWHVVNP